ncbi:MAG: hypothetical protein JNM71_18155 [Flavobacterium lindanitolerans]|uniref:hypothetical protein n=1 Tax=Flavobacterium lindanitolerans TaxID=428988 RepID=UPI001A4A21FA|nr:hypothetical protein [Flavobacterium lindanitolerans]MBL7869939.1 hypothetical protein [Flavobacterium lindanitolerans]
MITVETSECNILELQNEKRLVDLLYSIGSNKLAVSLCRTLDLKDANNPLSDDDRFIINELIGALIDIKDTPILVLEVI